MEEFIKLDESYLKITETIIRIWMTGLLRY